MLTLTNLPHSRKPYYCDCGRLARYALPVRVQLSSSRKNLSQRLRQETLHLCGRCLSLEIRLRREIPLSSDQN